MDKNPLAFERRRDVFPPDVNDLSQKDSCYKALEAEQRTGGVIEPHGYARMSDKSHNKPTSGANLQDSEETQKIKKEKRPEVISTPHRLPDGEVGAAFTPPDQLLTTTLNAEDLQEKFQFPKATSLGAAQCWVNWVQPQDAYLRAASQLKLQKGHQASRVAPEPQVGPNIKAHHVAPFKCAGLSHPDTRQQPAPANNIQETIFKGTQILPENEVIVASVGDQSNDGQNNGQSDILNQCISSDNAFSNAYDSGTSQRSLPLILQRTENEETANNSLTGPKIPVGISRELKQKEKPAILIQGTAGDELPIRNDSCFFAGSPTSITSVEPNLNEADAVKRPESPILERDNANKKSNLTQIVNKEPYSERKFVADDNTKNEHSQQSGTTIEPTSFTSTTQLDILPLSEDSVTQIAELGIDEIGSPAELRSHLSGVYFHIPKREWRAVIGRGNRRQQKTFSVRKYGFYAAKRHAEHFRTQFDLMGYVYDARRPPALATIKAQALSRELNNFEKPEGHSRQTQDKSNNMTGRQRLPSGAPRRKRNTAHSGCWTVQGEELSGEEYGAQTLSTPPMAGNNEEGDPSLLTHAQQPLDEEFRDDSQFGTAMINERGTYSRVPALRTHDSGAGTTLRRRRGGRRGRRGSLSATVRSKRVETPKLEYQDPSNIQQISDTSFIPGPVMDFPDSHDPRVDSVSKNPLKRRRISNRLKASRSTLREENPVSKNGHYGYDNFTESHNRNTHNYEALGDVTHSLTDEEPRDNSFDVVRAAEELLRALTLSLISASPTSPEQNDNRRVTEGSEVPTYSDVRGERDLSSDPDACLSEIIDLMDLELNHNGVGPQHAVCAERLPSYEQPPTLESEDGFEFHMRILNPNEDAQLHVSGCPRGQVGKTHSATLSQDSPDCLCPKVPIRAADQLLNTALGLEHPNALQSNHNETCLVNKNVPKEDTPLVPALRNLMHWSTGERCNIEAVHPSGKTESRDIPKGCWNETPSPSLSGNRPFSRTTAAKSRSCPQLPTLMQNVEKWNNFIMPTGLLTQSMTAGREGCIK